MDWRASNSFGFLCVRAIMVVALIELPLSRHQPSAPRQGRHTVSRNSADGLLMNSESRCNNRKRQAQNFDADALNSPLRHSEPMIHGRCALQKGRSTPWASKPRSLNRNGHDCAIGLRQVAVQGGLLAVTPQPARITAFRASVGHILLARCVDESPDRSGTSLPNSPNRKMQC